MDKLQRWRSGPGAGEESDSRAVRNGELLAARWDEFEPEADPPVWHLPDIRTRTGQSLDIPLPTMAVGGQVNAGEFMRQLIRSDAAEHYGGRLRDRSPACESGRGDMPDGDARLVTRC